METRVQPTAQQQTDAPLPDAPSASGFPVATVEPQPPAGTPVRIEALEQSNQGAESNHGKIWTLSGEVAIYYNNYILRADKVTYDSENHVATADGHVQLEGGPEHALITASRAIVNMDSESGRFYNVLGSIGIHRTGKTVIYSNTNPFIFTGRLVIKNGPEHYQIYDGSMTSCELPKPDWKLSSRHITIANGEARSTLTSFELLHVPLLYLPYVTHPTDATRRQSGFLIPTLGASSSNKGFVFGEQYYWAIDRSTDLTIGTKYYSKRGFEPSGEFRYRGHGLNFATARWSALLDRGVGTPKVNQGGLDLEIYGRRDLTDHLRAVSNIEYLSNYVYRLAFTENYQQAVQSEIKSDIYATYNRHGSSANVYFARYQNFQGTSSGDEVKILHTPALLLEVVDQPLWINRVQGALKIDLSDLSRSEPGFQIKDVGRLDIYPRISLPIVKDGWTFRPEFALRNTFYSKSQRPGVGVPTVRSSTMNRSDLELGFELRPPAVMRDFNSTLLGRQLRHVVEGEIRYRGIRGIGSDYRSVLQFDSTDLVSNTNEVLYSVTQRLFSRAADRACKKDEPASLPNGRCGAEPKETFTWQLAQKYFFSSHFGGALIPGRRNVLESTLDLTGPSFLTSVRSTSPVISRMRLTTTHNLGLEWDADYDAVEGRVAASNIFADYRRGNWAFGLGDALLDVPEEQGNVAQTTHFNQFRPFISYGNPSRTGLNLAANAGYDFQQSLLQYANVHAAWNWNCCGINVEYRRFSLGSERNENQYLFNLTLAGIGSAGTLRRAERLF